VQAAIFDFDGTLVDTMPLHFESYRRAFAVHGVELSHDDFYRNVGGNARQTIPKFLAGRSMPCSVEELHVEKKRQLDVLLDTVEIPQLECAKLLFALRPIMKIAMASSGARRGIEKMLTKLGWSTLFDVVVAGEDAAGKPAPDLFLLAAKNLNVAPAVCLAFEDTQDGVVAATAAGMTVFDVRRALASSAHYLTKIEIPSP
jgi:beta-phosphoglucomutase